MSQKKRVPFRMLGNWDPNLFVTVHDDGHETAGYQDLQVAALFAIRDELRKLNALLHCANFTGIPSVLKDIRRNTVKPKRKKRAPKSAA